MATASSSKAASNGSTAAPSPTLYVKNIEGKVKKPGKLRIPLRNSRLVV